MMNGAVNDAVSIFAVSYRLELKVGLYAKSYDKRRGPRLKYRKGRTAVRPYKNLPRLPVTTDAAALLEQGLHLPEGGGGDDRPSCVTRRSQHPDNWLSHTSKPQINPSAPLVPPRTTVHFTARQPGYS